MTKKILGGEAKQGAIGVVSGSGMPVDPGHAIFPIAKQLPDGRWQLIGTGFFISIYGVFATAKHVLMDVIDAHGNQRLPIAIIQFLPNNIYVVRPILRCTVSNLADTAIGVAAPMKNNKTGDNLMCKACSLTTRLPHVGERACTYAYPNTMMLGSSPQQIHLFPDFYDGKIEEYYPDGRDRVFLPSPCYRTSIAIHSGASGGPVFDGNGVVCGVNSTGFSGSNDISFVSRIVDILELNVTEVCVPGHQGNSFTVAKLAELGHVIIRSNMKPQGDAHVIETREGFRAGGS